jgi:hypothetical protein
VTLPQAAGVGGELVPLASNYPAAAVPATVVVPAGASSATFVITMLSVPVPAPVLISTGAKFGAALVVLRVLPLPAATGANLLVNGSFEQPPVPAGQAYSTLSPGKLPGWTIVRGTVDVDQECQQAPGQGRQSLDLVGDQLSHTRRPHIQI